MFDAENEMICWFDTTVRAEAIGVPEGVLNEFMFYVGGPIAIIERAYVSPGQVKAVIIKHFGSDVTMSNSGVPLESLKGLVEGFGLTFVSRPRSGMNVDFNGGRYYSSEHDVHTN
ncbi:hypothetical protein [Pseudomonas sp.]|uniref:hypothetical protein n=1 Tax=Pseudomonas sp. TaxID=306 RepID=UPI0028A179DC|nr:hypothetical protein [Pseudomonas sp.]